MLTECCLCFDWKINKKKKTKKAGKDGKKWQTKLGNFLGFRYEYFGCGKVRFAGENVWDSNRTSSRVEWKSNRKFVGGMVPSDFGADPFPVRSWALCHSVHITHHKLCIQWRHIPEQSLMQRCKRVYLQFAPMEKRRTKNEDDKIIVAFFLRLLLRCSLFASHWNISPFVYIGSTGMRSLCLCIYWARCFGSL